MYFLEARVPIAIHHYEEKHLWDQDGKVSAFPLIPSHCLSTAWQPLACSEEEKSLEYLKEKYAEISIETRIVMEEER